jgi:diguanylate cyclase (GGDEF)-like protein
MMSGDVGVRHCAMRGQRSEKFLILLPGADEDDAKVVAETIRSRVEAASLANPTSRAATYVTMSIGVAAAKRECDPVSPEQLQRWADTALYSAKSSGRNRVMAIGPEDEPPRC